MDYQTYQKLETLELQAWTLFTVLNRLVEFQCVGRSSRSFNSVRKERIYHAVARAHSRFQRRHEKLFSISKSLYKSYDFTIDSFVDGKYYECDCSECHIEDC